MANENKPVGETKTRELTLKRTFNAPLKQVWKAWTDPKQLAQWWGPKGFTNPRCDWDAKTGGQLYIDMKAPDGTVYPMDGVFEKVEELKCIVFKTAALDEGGKPLFEVLNTITFAEQDGKTMLTLNALATYTRPEATQYLDGMKEGWNQSLDKLADLVNPTAAREMTATRILNAPVKLVWKVFTEPEHIKNWWGPDGFTNTIHKMEVKPNGEWDFIMHGPDGTDYKNTNVYEEVIPHRRIVYNHVSPPLHHVTIELEDLGDKTGLTWRMVFPTAEIRDETIKKYKADIGLQQNLAKLGEYVENELANPSVKNQGAAFTIERTFNAPVERVWNAITDLGEMRKWYFDLKAFKPEAGFEFSLVKYMEETKKTFVHLFMVTEVVPGKKISYSWRYEGFDGNSLVTWELFPEGNKTRLKLTHAGTETFTPIPELAKERFEQGWTHIIGTSLMDYLGK